MAYRIFLPWPGIEPVLPEVEAWSLHHWTPKEVPEEYFIDKKTFASAG